MADQQSHANEELAPEIRDDLLQLQRRLCECSDLVAELFCDLREIEEAVRKAQTATECLLSDDPFEAWKQRKGDALGTTSAKQQHEGTGAQQADENNVPKLNTPEMQSQIIDLLGQLERFANGLLRDLTNLSIDDSLMWPRVASTMLLKDESLEICGVPATERQQEAAAENGLNGAVGLANEMQCVGAAQEDEDSFLDDF
jgi:hypothetical protein